MPSQPAHERTRLEKDRVLKQRPSDELRVEVEKTRRTHVIGQASGLFTVPRVMNFDETAGVALFERLDGLVCLDEYLRAGDGLREIVERLASALALIHRELKLPDDMVIPLPEAYSDRSSEVFLHGDISLNNVCVQLETRSLVILDWQTTPLLGGRATYGTRYFDLAWFLLNLFSRPTFGVLFSDPITPLAKSFAAAYAVQAGERFQTEEFFRYLKQFFVLELPRVRSYTSRRNYLLHPRSFRLLRKFLDGSKLS